MAKDLKAAPAADDVRVIVLQAPWDVFRACAVIRADAGILAQLTKADVAWREATERERVLAGK